MKIYHLVLHFGLLVSLQACKTAVVGNSRDTGRKTFTPEESNIGNLLSVDSCSENRPSAAVRPSAQTKKFKNKLAEPGSTKALFELRDLNGDGLLNRSELIAIAVDAGIAKAQASAMVTAFIQHHDCIRNVNEDHTEYLDKQLDSKEIENVLSYN